jgi:hypothetical protein
MTTPTVVSQYRGFNPDTGRSRLPVWAANGTPVNGTSGTAAGIANPGDLLIADDGGTVTLYLNTNTSLSPTWTALEAAGGSPTFDNVVATGDISAATVGATTPPAATVAALHVDTGTKTATASSGAATLNKMAGVITSESLTTAKGAAYTLTLTNSDIAAADQVMASVALGSSTTGTPLIESVTPSTGHVVVVVLNNDGTNAFNGTIKIGFVVFKN